MDAFLRNCVRDRKEPWRQRFASWRAGGGFTDDTGNKYPKRGKPGLINGVFKCFMGGIKTGS